MGCACERNGGSSADAAPVGPAPFARGSFSVSNGVTAAEAHAAVHGGAVTIRLEWVLLALVAYYVVTEVL